MTDKIGKITDKMKPEFMSKLKDLVGVKCGVSEPLPSYVKLPSSKPTAVFVPPPIQLPRQPARQPSTQPIQPTQPTQPAQHRQPSQQPLDPSSPYNCLQQTISQQAPDYAQMQMFMITQQQLMMQQQMMMQQHHQQTMAILLNRPYSAPQQEQPNSSVTMHAQPTPTFMIHKKDAE